MVCVDNLLVEMLGLENLLGNEDVQILFQVSLGICEHSILLS